MRSKKREGARFGIAILLLLIALGGLGWFLVSGGEHLRRENAEGMTQGIDSDVDPPVRTPRATRRTAPLSTEDTVTAPGVRLELDETPAFIEPMETAAPEELIEDPAEQISVDLVCQFPAELDAAYWKPLMHRLCLVGTDDDRRTQGHVGRPRLEANGSWIVPRVLTYRPASEFVAIAILAAFAPHDEFGRVMPGHIAFFAGHAVGADTRSANLVLESNAATVDFLVRLTEIDRWTGRLDFRLGSIASLFRWESAKKSLPHVWPGSVDSCFLQKDDGDLLGSRLGMSFTTCGTEADSASQVCFWGAPMGLTISDWVIARDRQRKEDRHYLLDVSDLPHNNHYRNDTRERFCYPRNESTIWCYPDRELQLPQIVFENDPPLSLDELAQGIVICSNHGAREIIARAKCRRSERQWRWGANLGRSVVFGHFDGGGGSSSALFHAILPGYRSAMVRARPEANQITFYLEPLQEPWTIAARVTGTVGRLPAKIRYRRSKSSPAQSESGWTDRDGTLRLEQREGPLDGETSSGCYVRVELDIDRLRDELLQLLPASEALLELHVTVDHHGVENGHIDVATRTMSCECSAKILVGADATEAVPLQQFLGEQQLLDAFMQLNREQS